MSNIEIMIPKEELFKRIKELGKQISEDYQGKTVKLICVLKGGIYFLTELSMNIDEDVPVELDFMAVSSYGNEQVSSGIVKIIKDLDEPIEGQDIIIIEDIIDSGNTLSYLINILWDRKPNSIEVCTLLDKPSRRVVDVEVKYCGFQVPDVFVLGFGLDVEQKYRNLPYIGKMVD